MSDKYVFPVLTAVFEPPIPGVRGTFETEVDKGGWRIDIPSQGAEQIAFIWNYNRRWKVRENSPDSFFGSEDAKAFAQLFTAAPQLLVALEQMLHVYGSTDSLSETARFAIKLARGEL